MKKRVISLVMASLMITSLIGCGKTEVPKEVQPSESVEAMEEVEEAVDEGVEEVVEEVEHVVVSAGKRNHTKHHTYLL